MEAAVLLAIQRYYMLVIRRIRHSIQCSQFNGGLCVCNGEDTVEDEFWMVNMKGRLTYICLHNAELRPLHVNTSPLPNPTRHVSKSTIGRIGLQHGSRFTKPPYVHAKAKQHGTHACNSRAGCSTCGDWLYEAYIISTACRQK